MARLVKAMDEALSELELAHELQFDTKATLYDKLSASKVARAALKKCRRCQTLISQALHLDE